MKKYALIVITLFLVSCNFNKTYENRESDKEEAQKITERFYSSIKENNEVEVFKLFSKRFFEITSKEKLYQVIDKTEREYGKVQKDSLSSWQTFVAKGTNPISKYEMIYQVKREIGNTQEVITLQKENDTVKIIGYRIDFDIVPQK